MTLLVALVAAGGPLSARAASWGSITLDCRVSGVPLAGDTYGLVCVADVTYDAAAGTITSYATRDAFASFGYDWPNMKSSELDEAAKSLASHAGEKNLYERTAVSDASGSVGFWGLEPGLYLVARIATADANAGYACDPLLITVPLADGGQLDWSVASQPKFGEPEPDEPGPDEPGPDEPGPDEPGPDEPGPDEPGPDEPGPDEPEPDEPDNPEGPEEPDEPESPGTPESPSAPGTPETTWSLLAETGDVAFTGIGALLVLGGAAVILAGVIRSRSKADPAEAVPGDDPNGPAPDNDDLAPADAGEAPDPVPDDASVPDDAPDSSE